MMSFEVLPAMGIKPELVVLASAACATVSLAINLFGGVVREQKRAEAQLEVRLASMGAWEGEWVWGEAACAPPR